MKSKQNLKKYLIFAMLLAESSQIFANNFCAESQKHKNCLESQTGYIHICTGYLCVCSSSQKNIAKKSPTMSQNASRSTRCRMPRDPRSPPHPRRLRPDLRCLRNGYSWRRSFSSSQPMLQMKRGSKPLSRNVNGERASSSPRTSRRWTLSACGSRRTPIPTAADCGGVHRDAYR